MKDFKASEHIFICDDCGDEMKVLNSVYLEGLDGTGYWEFDLECRNCGPQGKDFIYDNNDSNELL